MKLFNKATTMAILTAGMLASSATMAEQVVRVYNWSDYIAEETLAQFTEETGIKVNVAHLDKGMVERLQAEGDRSPADLVFTVDVSRIAAVVNADAPR